MTAEQTVLLVGGTGRTGRRVVEQLLGREAAVRAIVRSVERLPAGVATNPRLTVVEADLLSLSDAELRGHVRGCGAVVSCLGHVLSLKGLFGPPRDLVTRATTRLCQAVEAVRPAKPVRFILMSSVSVNRPGRLDARRGMFERAFVATIRGMLPPAKDNQRAADFLWCTIGADNPFVQWTAVRPDTLLGGEISEYELHEELVSSVFRPDSTNMANVAHFMCELATDPKVWGDWKGKLPVVVNAGPRRQVSESS
jgi:nucleoside-diphosphate-sugar epimerase